MTSSPRLALHTARPNRGPRSRRLLLLIAALSSFFLLLSNPSQAALFNTAQKTEFLPVEQAFQPMADIHAGQITLRWHVSPGYYLYDKHFHLGWADSTANLPALSPGGIKSPSEYIEDPNFGRVKIYREDVALSMPMRVSAKNFPESAVLNVRYQGCAAAGLCYPPQMWAVTVKRADLMADAAAPDAAQQALSAIAAPDAGTVLTPAVQHDSAVDIGNADALANWLAKSSFLVVLSTFLLLGLGLAFTPCVLPMLPILSAIIAGQKTTSSRQGFLLALSYVLGMSLMYTLAGLLIASLGASANLSNLLQKPAVLSVFAAFFVFLAWVLASGRDLRLPSGMQTRLTNLQNRQSGGTYGTVFIMGAISSLVLSPCVSAPLAGILIYLGAQGDALLGASALFCLSLGMGAPLLLLGAGGGRWLPRSGPWLDLSKQFFAIMLLAVAVSLINRLLPAPQQLLLWAAFFTLIAVWLVGTALWRKVLAVMLIVWAGALLWGSAKGHIDALKPWHDNVSEHTSQATDHQGNSNKTAIAKTYYNRSITDPALLQPAIAAANAEGKPVMVDVYADWCISCVAMEREVLNKPETLAVLAKGVVIRFDITATSTAQLDWVQQQKLFGPPALLFWNTQGQSKTRVVGETDLPKFLKAVNSAWN